MQRKRAILVVSHGTSHHHTLTRNIDAIEHEIAGAYPDWEIRRAFTSGMIIRKLQKHHDMHVDTMASALTRLHAEGFGTVICQPTHVLNGEEFDSITADLQPFAERFDALHISKPLLTDAADYRMLAQTMAEAFPVETGTAICLIGHGSRHPKAATASTQLDAQFKAIGRNDIAIGMLNDNPDANALIQQFAKCHITQVILAPLMVVAGGHAQNDIAGDQWKTAFENEGYPVRCVFRGLGEYPGVRKQYVAHLREAMETLHT